MSAFGTKRTCLLHCMCLLLTQSGHFAKTAQPQRSCFRSRSTQKTKAQLSPALRGLADRLRSQNGDHWSFGTVMGGPHPKGLIPSYPFTMTVPYHIFGSSVAIEQSSPRCTSRAAWCLKLGQGPTFRKYCQSFNLLRISHNVGLGIPGVDNDRRRFRPHTFRRAKGR